MTSIFEPLPLKHGGPLPNRLAKAAMEEQLGTENMLPSQGIFNLYRTWARGGVGLIITGNVMVDYRAVTNGCITTILCHSRCIICDRNVDCDS